MEYNYDASQEVNVERLQADKACSYTEFIDLIEFLVTQVFGMSLSFRRDVYSNPKSIEAPCISYSLITKVPGRIGKGSKELKPRLRNSFTKQDGDKVIVYGQRFDTLVQFDIWAQEDKVADTLELRFENMITQYTGFLRQKGVVDIYFDGQLADSNAQNLRLDLSCRSLRYLVLLEQLTESSVRDIENIFLTYSAQKESPANADDITQTISKQ